MEDDNICDQARLLLADGDESEGDDYANRKGTATGSKGGKRGVSAPSNEHAQEKMKSGNPTPAAESSKRASQKGKPSKKGGK
ncbi:MAG TPA: hypothetical protein VGC89_11710 [Pyrinomonadaceae bacterium]